ncbi:MAG: hypothetical protein JEZ06_21810 [Anaerolineaceae bacterium]|nr:hypothetical protein [Anaerolineaceae bacterium]
MKYNQFFLFCFVYVLMLSACTVDNEIHVEKIVISSATVVKVDSTNTQETPALVVMKSEIIQPEPTPMPPQPTYIHITPNEAQFANWKEYENALANKIMFYEVSNGDEIICEWKLLGQDENELYVWAICTTIVPLPGSFSDFYPSSSIPAVIQLNDDGDIFEVKTPGDYASDIRNLFPADVQEIIFHQRLDIKNLMEHLIERRGFPDNPPLIELSATSMP